MSNKEEIKTCLEVAEKNLKIIKNREATWHFASYLEGKRDAYKNVLEMLSKEEEK